MRRKHGRLALVCVAAGLGSAALLVVAASGLAADLDPQTLFVDTYKCQTCHSAKSAGIEAKSEKMGGGDLSGYQTDDFDALAEYLRKEVDREGGKHKKGFTGSDEELKAIIDWLGAMDPVEE